MKLLPTLQENGLASLERESPSRKMGDAVTVLVTAHINRNGVQTGSYLIQMSKFMKKPHEVIECANYDDLVAKLLPGEAESNEWADM